MRETFYNLSPEKPPTGNQEKVAKRHVPTVTRQQIAWLWLLTATAILLLLAAPVQAAGPGFTADNVSVAPGATAALSVSIENNPGLAAFEIYADFDTNALSVTSADAGAILGANTTFTPNCDGGKGHDFLCGGINSDNITEDGVLFTLTFTAASNAIPGVYPVTLSYSPTDTIDESCEEIAFTTTDGYITITGATPQTTVMAAQMSGQPGDTLAVPVTISHNPGLAAFKIYVDYDRTPLTLNAARPADILSTGTFTANLDGHDGHDFACVWINATDIASEGTLFTLDFTLKDDAVTGAYPITLSYSPPDTFNTAYEDVELTLVNGVITITGGAISFTIDSVSAPVAGTTKSIITGSLSGLSADAAATVRLVVAVYDARGRMVDLSMQAVRDSVSDDGAWSTQLQLPPEEYVIKAFLLDSAAGFRPVAATPSH